MKHIKDNIYIENSIVYELMSSIFYIQNYEVINSNPHRKKYISKDTIEWLAIMDAQLNDGIRKEIEVFFDIDSYCIYGLIGLVYKYGVLEDIQRFMFHFLTKVTASEIVTSFLGPIMNQVNEDDSKDLTPQKALELLKESALPEREKWKLTYFFMNVDVIKERLMELISDYYRLYFKKSEKAISETYNQDNLKLEKILNSKSTNKINTLLATDVEFLEEFNKVIVFPVHNYGVSLTNFVFEDNIIFLIGMDRLKLIEIDRVEDSLDSLKAITDEKRIRIIRLLNEKNYYGYEIGQKLGLSDSTISHHLSVLAKAKVVEPLRRENKVYYKVNKIMIEDILERAKLLLT